MTKSVAFDEILADAIATLPRAFVGVRGLDGSEDAVAEALAWAWEHQERLIEMGNPVGYLYRVGLTRTQPRKSPELPRPPTIGLPEIEPRLIPALLNLPSRQREAVWLTHACGWALTDIGQAMGISRSSVSTHVARALTSLRRTFDDHG